MPFPTTMTQTVGALALAIAAGAASGVTPLEGRLPGADARVTHTVPAPARAALALTDADEARIASARPIGLDFERFVRPGVVERSGNVFVEMRTDRAMGAQVTSDVRDGFERAVRNAGTLRERVATRQARAFDRVAPSVLESFDDLGGHRVRVPEGMTEEQFAEILLATGDYASVEPDWTCYPLTTTPNDSQFGNQYHHGVNHLNTVNAWDYTTGSGSVVIAVGDTGVDLDHPDLESALLPGYNAVDRLTQAEGGDIADNNGHGSGAIGCAAAIGNNGIGVAGMGWNFSILPMKVSNAPGGGAASSDLRHAANWAADNGATSISLSYGGVESAGGTGTSVQRDGATLFWSSGNDGSPIGNDSISQAVVVVGAVGTSGNRVGFSNYGPSLDIMAHGVSVRSTSRTGGYTWFGGTSAAAPLASGAAGLVFSANPDLRPIQVRSILYDTATDLGSPGFDNFNGWGRINAGAAVLAALTGDFSTPFPVEDDFDNGSLSSAVYIDIDGAGINGDGVGEPSGPDALNLSGTDSVSTVEIDPSGATTGAISFYVQHRGVEAGEAMIVEYFDSTWLPLTTLISDGRDIDGFSWVGAQIPTAALDDGLRIRFRAFGDEANDEWYIDDLLIDWQVTQTAPFLDTFETAADTDFAWATFGATGDGSGAAFLGGANTIETGAIDVTNYLDGTPAFLSFEIDGASATQSLLAEVRTATGTWQSVGTYAPGSAQLVETELDPQWLSDSFAVRLTSQEPSGATGFAIDNVYVGDLKFATACGPADIDGDGDADPDDISAFVAAFTDGIAGNADVDGDGDEDPDDIAAFVAQFVAGC